MKAPFALLVTLVASASAFHVGVPPARVVARSTSTARGAGYVPDGLTEKEWEAMKKKKAAEAASRKKYFREKKSEPLVSFLKGMEKGRKHTFAKVDDSLTKLPPAGARGVKQS